MPLPEAHGRGREVRLGRREAGLVMISCNQARSLRCFRERARLPAEHLHHRPGYTLIPKRLLLYMQGQDITENATMGP